MLEFSVDDDTEAVNITGLNKRISEIEARQNELHTAIDEIVADLEETNV